MGERGREREADCLEERERWREGLISRDFEKDLEGVFRKRYVQRDGHGASVYISLVCLFIVWTNFKHHMC